MYTIVTRSKKNVKISLKTVSLCTCYTFIGILKNRFYLPNLANKNSIKKKEEVQHSMTEFSAQILKSWSWQTWESIWRHWDRLCFQLLLVIGRILFFLILPTWPLLPSCKQQHFDTFLYLGSLLLSCLRL